MKCAHPAVQATPNEPTLTGLHAGQNGTTLGDAICRWLHLKDYVQYNKVLHTMIMEVAMTTMTDLSRDGVPMRKESLHHFVEHSIRLKKCTNTHQ